MQKPLILILPLALLAACSSAPPVATAPSPVQSRSPTAGGVAASVKPSVVESDDSSLRPSMRSVYFPYDNFKLDAKYEQMIGDHAGYLARNPAVHVTLEGSADERGSREYNLALGQKRADALRTALKLHGVPDTQMEATSYGKEKPRALCHEESCWQENRRADIAYSASK